MIKKRYNFGPLAEKAAHPERAYSDRQPASPDFVKKINARIAAFHLQPMSRKVSNCSADDLAADALEMDPDKGPVAGMIKVSDTGPLLSSLQEITEARRYFHRNGRIPKEWAAYLNTGKHPPFSFKKASFINFFGRDRLLLLDIFRPPWKNYYTSDVFFSQWLRALGADKGVQNLPDAFPRTLYVNNISNPLTRRELGEVFLSAGADVCSREPGELLNWNRLIRTPHMKCVLNILNDYNRIKRLPPEQAYGIKTIQFYREEDIYNLKLHLIRQSRD